MVRQAPGFRWREIERTKPNRLIIKCLLRPSRIDSPPGAPPPVWPGTLAFDSPAFRQALRNCDSCKFFAIAEMVEWSKPLGCSPSNPSGKPRRFKSCSPHQCAPDADGDASGLQTHDRLFGPGVPRACSGIAYTPVLETGVLGYESSSLSGPTLVCAPGGTVYAAASKTVTSGYLGSNSSGRTMRRNAKWKSGGTATPALVASTAAPMRRRKPSYGLAAVRSKREGPFGRLGSRRSVSAIRILGGATHRDAHLCR